MNMVAKSEIYRMRKSAGTYITAALLALLAVGSVVASMLANHFLNGQLDAFLQECTFFNGFSGYATLTIVQMFLSIYVASMVMKMYQSGAVKQVVSCGIRRKNIILGQFRGLAEFLGIMTLILATIQGICYVIPGGLGSVNPAHLILSVTGTLVTVSFVTALTMMFAHLTKNLPATIVATAAIMIGSNMVLSNASLITGNELFKKFSLSTIESNATALDVSFATQITGIAILAAATALLVAITIAVFRKKEIK